MPTDTLIPAATSVRRLPPEEWSRLADFPIAQGYMPDPTNSEIVVAETADGQIVGLWAAVTAVHLEGLWIAPSHRKSPRVATQLLDGMGAVLRAFGIVHSFAVIPHRTPEILTLALKAGFQRLPMDLCLLDTRPPEAR